MNSDLNKQIGKRLKELRESKNLTRKELSAKLNISEGGLEKWESGEREIGTDNLYLIAKYFNVDFNYLYGIESRKDDKPQFTGYKNIGKRLKQRREELGYSRSELGQKKFSCYNIEDIELNNYLCDYNNFMRIAKALNMSFDELICGNEPDKFFENEYTQKREAELVFDGVIDTELFGGCDSPEFVNFLINKYYITPREKLIEMYKTGEYSKIRQYFVDCEYDDGYLSALNTIKDKDLINFILSHYVPMPPCHGIEIDTYPGGRIVKAGGRRDILHTYSEEGYKEHLIEKRREILFKSVKTMYDGVSCFDETNAELEECYSKNQYTDIQYCLYKRLCYKLYWFFNGKLEWIGNKHENALDLYDKFSSIKSVPKDIDKNFRYLLQVTRNQNCELSEEQLKSCEKFIKNISAFY
ncbi:MAG: helix-turn-helix domain-containing protein [Turicibacter sp.]|nr:helix-turn-helix domain-containing protein [Turicibacter sp.]